MKSKRKCLVYLYEGGREIDLNGKENFRRRKRPVNRSASKGAGRRNVIRLPRRSSKSEDG